MVSHPDAVRALYTERAHGLPPGARCRCARSSATARSCCSRAPSTCRAASSCCRRSTATACAPTSRSCARPPPARSRAGPTPEPFAVHPSMQAITLEVIMRAVFGVADRERLADHLRELLRLTASPNLQFVVLVARRFNGPDPLAKLDTLTADIDEILLAEIAERRADPDTAQREDICSMLVGARFEDGEPMSDREIRDQLMTLLVAGHETTATGARLDARPARPPPGGARAAPTGGRRRRGDVPARRDRRVAAPAPGRPARRPAPGERPARRRPRPARRHRRHARDLAHPHARRHSTPSPTRSAPSASSTVRRRPTRGSRSAAASAAASAPRSPRWRCASCWRRSCAAASCAPPAATPSASPGATSRSRRATAHVMLAARRT